MIFYAFDKSYIQLELYMSNWKHSSSAYIFAEKLARDNLVFLSYN